MPEIRGSVTASQDGRIPASPSRFLLDAGFSNLTALFSTENRRILPLCRVGGLSTGKFPAFPLPESPPDVKQHEWNASFPMPSGIPSPAIALFGNCVTTRDFDDLEVSRTLEQVASRLLNVTSESSKSCVPIRGSCSLLMRLIPSFGEYQYSRRISIGLLFPIAPVSMTVVSRVPTVSNPSTSCLPRSSSRGAPGCMCFADGESMGHRITDLDLSYNRLVLAVLGHKDTALLEYAAVLVAGNRPVILQRNGIAVGELLHRFCVHRGREKCIGNR